MECGSAMIYEWKCKKCGHKTEVSRSVEDRNVEPDRYLDNIPHTHDHDWIRVLSMPNVPFEGLRRSGIFADDNGNFAPRKI